MGEKSKRFINYLKSQTTEDEHIDDYVLQKFWQDFGWKAILLYQYQTGYILTVILACFLSIIIAASELAFLIVAYSRDNPEVWKEGRKIIAYFYFIELVYFLDFLMRIAYKLCSWENTKLFYEEPVMEALVIDFVSLLPLEKLYMMVADNKKVIVILRLRVLMRLVRFVSGNLLLLKDFSARGLKMTLFRMFCIHISTIFTISLIHYAVYCLQTTEARCEVGDYYKLFQIFYISLRNTLGLGAHVNDFVAESMQHVYIFANVFFLLHNFYLVSIFTCIQIEKYKWTYTFMQLVENVKFQHHIWKKKYIENWSDYDELVVSTVRNHLVEFYRHRHGIVDNNILNKIIPESMTKYIRADASFEALIHSRIFRRQPQHILRFTANLMKFEFGVPGDIIIHSDVCNFKMIYISSGVVQILSNQNDETPVLSLSSGTCLCESSLFIAFTSSCTVICQTYCEFVVLDSSKFRSMAKMYPEVYRDMLSSIKNRVSKAKLLRDLAMDWFKVHTEVEKSSLLVMSWIKAFNLETMYNKKTFKINDKRLALSNQNVQSYIDNLVFYVKYLDRLAVTDEIQLVKDLVFYKKSFHFILQPNSPLLKLWNGIVIILTVTFVIGHPYLMAFFVNTPGEALAVIYFITGAFIVDVYLKIATCVKTSDEYLVTLKSIIVYRVRTSEFILDCIAMLPLEILINALGGRLPTRTFYILMCNRLAKYYKINKFFNNEESLNQKLITYTDTIKFAVNAIFIFYYLAFLVYILNCPGNVCLTTYAEYYKETESFKPFSKLVSSFSIAIDLLSGVHFGHLPKSSISTFATYIVFAYFFYIFNLLFISGTTTKHSLLQLEQLEDQESLLNTNKLITNSTIVKESKQKLQHYVKKMWNFRTYRKTTFNLQNSIKFHESEFRNIAFFRVMSKNKTLKALPDECLRALGEQVTRHTIPANTYLSHISDLPTSVILIEAGYCKITIDGYSKMLVENDIFGLISVIVDRPNICDAITVTDCIILEITKKNFYKVVRKMVNLDNMLKECYVDEIYDIFIERSNIKDCYTTTGVRETENVNLLNFFRVKGKEVGVFLKRLFSCKAKIDTSLGGNFVFYWECLRCVTICGNCFFSSLKYFSRNGKIHKLQFVFLYSCDIHSCFDMVLRFFITYYNSEGIEITSRKKTVIRYLTHSFLTDLLGSIPFDLFLSSFDILFTRSNRLLLLYRLIFFNYYLTDRVQKVKHCLLVYILILVVIFCSYMSSLMVYVKCPIDAVLRNSKIIYTADLGCTQNSWIIKSNLASPNVTIQQSYMESYLMFVSSILGVGFYKFVLGIWYERLYICLFAVAGYLFKTILIGKLISYTLFQNADLTTYQEAMKNLVSYLSYCRVDKAIKREIINYFEYIWVNHERKNIMKVNEKFPLAVKQNLLYEIYAPYLRVNKLFRYADMSFLRALLLIGTHSTFLKTGILYRKNDINEYIYYLCKGLIEVVGPDNNKIVILSPGSLLGCLDNCTMSRTTLMMVAKGHVDTLVFKSTEFYKIISKFPGLKRQYRKLIRFNTDYVESKYTEKKDRKQTPLTSESSHLLRFTKMLIPKQPRVEKLWNFMNGLKKIFTPKILKPNPALHYFHLLILIVQFFLIMPLEGALQIVKPTSIHYVCLYVVDIIWWVRTFLIFHTAYENEYGMLVFSRKEIAEKYMLEKFGFYYDFLCNLPLDIFVIIYDTFSNEKHYGVYIILRFNRLFRVFHLYIFMQKLTQKLNINVFVIRSLYSIMCLIYWICFLHIFFYLFGHGWTYSEPTFFQSLEQSLLYADIIISVMSETCVSRQIVSNVAAILILTFIVIIHLALVVYFYSKNTATLQIVTKSRADYKQISQNILKFAGMIEVSTPITDELVNYFNLLLKYNNGVQYPFLLDEAQSYLREAVINSMFGFHLKNHPVFKDCHMDLLRQLASTMKSITYFNGNYITFKGDIDETCYFIHQGQIHALSKDSLYIEQVEHILLPGDCFGLSQVLFPRCGHFFTFKAAILSVVVTIERKTLLKLLEFFPASKIHIYNQDFDTVCV